MLPRVSAVELIAFASSLSLLAGWRLYLVLFVTGLGMRLGWIALPATLEPLAVLAEPWLLAIAGAAAVAEFFADKIPWVDSLWDGVHGVVRPVGGALISLAVIDSADPAWQVAGVLLGGGGALVAHLGKAGARTLVNASPEPFSNAAVSTGEDLAVGGLLAVALSSPLIAAVVAALLVAASLWLVIAARRALRRLIGPPRPRAR